MSEQNQHAEALFQKLEQEKKRRRRKIWRTVLIIIAVVAIVLVAAVTVLRRWVEVRFAANTAEVQAYQVSTGTIHTLVAGSGILAEEDQEQITVPYGVEVTEVVVEAGDLVKQGDLLARVDMAGVMTALSDIQEQLDDLDDEISDAKGDTVGSTITAGVSGRVKVIYAGVDTDVTACMAENGALAVLSLDGYMAADLETEQLLTGDKVSVTLSDGSTLEGKVGYAAGGKATVLVTDDGPAVDAQVTVALPDGSTMEAALYIHNPLAVTGYAGTVKSVNAKLNGKVSASTGLFQLKNTSFSANYDTLLRSRADLEEVLMDLLKLYRDSALLAPMDGRISSVEFDKDLDAAYYTAADGSTNVLTLYPDLTMSIAISVDETDILSLEEGQAAQVEVSSVSSEEAFPGTVTQISKVADTSTGVTRYSAEVTLDKTPGMLAGMTASVDIRIQGVENALLIPVDALHQTRDTYFVYTAYDPQINQYSGRVDVTIGMQNDSQVEILSGLTEGQTIYYTEAPQNIFSFMMGQMGGGMNGGMNGGMPSGMGGGRPSGNMGGPGGANRGG